MAPHGTVAGDPRKATASPAAEPTERAAAGATGNVAIWVSCWPRLVKTMKLDHMKKVDNHGRGKLWVVQKEKHPIHTGVTGAYIICFPPVPSNSQSNSPSKSPSNIAMDRNCSTKLRRLLG